MQLQQFDITAAYLNGILEEDVYMEVPAYLEDALKFIINEGPERDPVVAEARSLLASVSRGDKVFKMKKAIYGLRQAGRAWHNRLDLELRRFGAVPSKADPCMYLKGEGSRLIVIIIYVDDIVVASKTAKEISRLAAHLEESFELKRLGDLKYCLGIQFERTEAGMKMYQGKYVEEILRRFAMEDCKPVSTPLSVGIKLVKEEPWNESDGPRPPYRELVGSLLYLSVATRPDVAHATSVLGQYNDCFGKSHWTAAKRVLRYLKGTRDLGITFKSGGDAPCGYVDADWGGSLDDRRSFTGYAFLWSHGPVTWDSRKQRTVALSSTEAEYMALSEASKEAIYIKCFLGELGVDLINPLQISGDNLGAQKLVENPVYHSRTKHIDIRHHFVRDVWNAGKIQLKHVPTERMPADVLTKALSKAKHWTCVQLLGLATAAEH